MVFGSILVTSIISVCLHTGMFVKVTKSFLRVKTIHQACGSCLFENQKSIAGFRAACATKMKSKEGESSCAVAKKWKSLTNLDLVELIRESGIKSCTELLAIAEESRTAAQMNITTFAFRRNEKILHELVTKTWQM